MLRFVIKNIKKVQATVLFLCLIFISSCVKVTKRTNNTLKAHENEARLIDVPIPIDSTFVADKAKKGSIDSKCCMLFYSTKKSLQEVKVFYEKEMERFGWRVSAECSDRESTLLFEKPSKVCVVSVRPGDGKAGSSNLFVISSTSKK